MLDLLKTVFADSACACLFWVLMFVVILLIVIVDICIVSIDRKNRERNIKKGNSHDFKEDPKIR